MKYTDEQLAVIEGVRSGDNLKVQALAGTGKTSTLAAAAEVNKAPSLYVCFNKPIQLEAEKKFPGHVDCRTFASLGYGAAPKYFGASPKELLPRGFADIAMDDVKRITSVTSGRDCSWIRRTFANWCESGDPQAHWRQAPSEAKSALRMEAVDFAMRNATMREGGKFTKVGNDHIAQHVGSRCQKLADGANALWAAMCAREIPCTMAALFKRAVLEGHQMKHRVVFVDEAQDLSGAQIQFVEQQNAQTIIVGDSHQSIYGWRGARDSMQTLAGAELPMTQSFRFGSVIEGHANRVLVPHLNAEYPIVGVGPKSDLGDQRCELSRGNRAVLTSLLSYVRQGVDVHVTGRHKDVVARLTAALELFKYGESSHPALRIYPDYEKAKEDLEDNFEWAEMFAMVESAGDKAEDILDTLSTWRNADKDAAEVVLSTAHSSKGCEWPYVHLDEDFAGRLRKAPSDEEYRLLYVAITRGQLSTTIPDVIWEALESTAAAE